MTSVRAPTAAERAELAAFLAFARAEPYPETPEGWIQREAEARRRWPAAAALFDGWGVDAASALGHVGSE
jgi:hypothetical protein